MIESCSEAAVAGETGVMTIAPTATASHRAATRGRRDRQCCVM
jgi:hypothetical protein